MHDAASINWILHIWTVTWPTGLDEQVWGCAAVFLNVFWVDGRKQT
jgi:hypothetical protein